MITGTVSGATVALYSAGVLLGSATASGSSTTVTTNGTAALADGTALITAVQTFASAPSPVSAAVAITIDTARPTLVGTPVINVGTNQAASRSQVRTITWTFSEPVAVGLANFVLTNRDTNTPVSLTSRSVSVTGNTVTLTLDNYGVDSGPGLFLANANYDLALSSTVADAAGNTLDANGDGTAGETAHFQFYKLIGDFNGNRIVDFTDFLMFQSAFGQTAAATDAGLDLNANGTIDFSDFLVFQVGFGSSVNAMPGGLTFTSAKKVKSVAGRYGVMV